MKYSQGVMSDGPVILCDGEPMTPEQIVERLNGYYSMLQLFVNERDRVNGFRKNYKPARKTYPRARNL
jgi:hypothetical protein